MKKLPALLNSDNTLITNSSSEAASKLCLADFATEIGDLSEKYTVYHINPPVSDIKRKRHLSLIKQWVRQGYLSYIKPIPLFRSPFYWFWRKIEPIYVRYFFLLLAPKNVKEWFSLTSWVVFAKNNHGSKYAIASKTLVNIGTANVFPMAYQHLVQDNQTHYTFPALSVTKINQARIHGGTNFVITNKKVLCHSLYDFKRDYTSEEVHRRIIFNQRLNRVRWLLHGDFTQKIAEAASFIDACAPNYAHWLTEVLPRINLFCSDKRFDRIPIVINGDLHKNIMESLFLLVDNQREIIILPLGCALDVSSLYLTSPTGYIPFDRRKKSLTKHSHGVFSPYALHQLRQHVLNRLPIANDLQLMPKKIYLRRKSASRKLLNEPEIEALLVAKGFTVIEPETLSFAKQVALFQQAEIVISPTGAACANIIFSNPDTQFVILMAIHPGMSYRYWLNMAAAVGIKQTTYILGKIVQNTAFGVHADFQIDATDINNYLKTLDN